jgi:hypothetical protein
VQRHERHEHVAAAIGPLELPAQQRGDVVAKPPPRIRRGRKRLQQLVPDIVAAPNPLRMKARDAPIRMSSRVRAMCSALRGVAALRGCTGLRISIVLNIYSLG